MKHITRLIALIAAAVLLVCGWKILSVSGEYRTAAQEYDDLRAQVQQTGEGSVSIPAEQTGSPEAVQLPMPDSIDFASLQQRCGDVIGWIQFVDADIPINYPIVHTASNDDYLRKNIDGKYSRPGSIILESENAADLQDIHTIIYGHNMLDSSMFSTLKKYEKQEFYASHSPYFFLYTPEHIYLYCIFACHDVDKNSSLYQTGFSVDDTWEQFVQEEMLRSAWYDTGILPQRNDRIVTLSTCTEDKGNRFAVHARRVCELVRNS